MIKEKLNEQGIYASFNTDDKAGKKMLYNAINTKPISLVKIAGSVIDVVAVAVVPATLNDTDDGEVKEVTRCIFIDEKGDYYGGTGECLFKNLDSALDVFGEPSESDPISFKVNLNQSSNNSMYNYISLAVV